MSITRSDFGKTKEGQRVDLFILTNAAGMEARIISHGATITQLLVPDRRGERANVVLGFDNIKQYQGENPFFGATIGRFANRIAGGQFTLDGVTYKLPINNGPNTLHGGPRGFDKLAWSAKESGDSVSFTLVSPDGDQGFP